jgi:radical SAM enzyme (rSAM/lipoprotein system)
MSKIAQFFFNQFKKNEAKIHELTYLFWECTQRCNLRCRHCGSDCALDSGIPDMPADDFLKAILPVKEVYKPEKITVAITGGEPLLHRELYICGRTLREHGFHWGIVTNGYAYTQDVHQKLLAAGMESITLSLDGFEDSHNWLRGNAMSYKNALRALRLITAESGLIYDVVTCVHAKNIRELPDFREFLIAENVRAWRLFAIAPIGRAADEAAMRLSGEEVTYLMDFIARARGDNRIHTEFCCGAYTGKYELKVRDSGFFCRAGINIASVLIDGSISACPIASRCFLQGNIYRDAFMDVWNNRFEVMRDRAWTKTGICRDCREYPNCGGGALHLWDARKDTPLACLYKEMAEVGKYTPRV